MKQEYFVFKKNKNSFIISMFAEYTLFFFFFMKKYLYIQKMTDNFR